MDQTRVKLASGIELDTVDSGPRDAPALVFLHGFPESHRTWRHQIAHFSDRFRCIAPDQRGYRGSSKPQDVSAYTPDKLIGDVFQLADALGVERFTLVGHDWGGAIAWAFAATHPEMTDRLIILNLPHPNGLSRELATNPEQRKNSAYARNFQKDDTAKKIMPEVLAMWVKEPEARKLYAEALGRSSMEGMLNYYKANYPREPYTDGPKLPPVKCSVLMIHGLDDKFLLPGALNDTWKWVEKDLTLITVPGAGHFVHRDKPEFVTKKMAGWLAEK
jgi:pimeloyl-ACP methyl ester carboxylesterase